MDRLQASVLTMSMEIIKSDKLLCSLVPNLSVLPCQKITIEYSFYYFTDNLVLL